MIQARRNLSRGFTFWEIITIFFLTLICVVCLAPFFFSIFHIHGPKNYRSSCASNMKQTGIALLGYAQDYDGRLPPAAALTELDDVPVQQPQSNTAASTPGLRMYPVPHVLVSFVRNPQIFHCPSAGRAPVGLSYMYNDLAAGGKISGSSQPARSILMAESENRLNNIGHAKSTRSEGDAAVFYTAQKSKAGRLALGASVGDASVRHAVQQGNGANYLFIDGHVKWNKPEDVFFPPRQSSSQSHRDTKTGTLIGPDPEGITEVARTFQGKAYAATFHLR